LWKESGEGDIHDLGKGSVICRGEVTFKGAKKFRPVLKRGKNHGRLEAATIMRKRDS